MKPTFPSDEDMQRIQKALEHWSSLNQQIADRNNRGASDLSQIQIEPRDPLDILLHELQAESERNKETGRLNGNAIRAAEVVIKSVTTGLFLANRKIQELEKQVAKKRKKK